MKLIDNMLEGIEACLFDLDGTLVDSMWMWEEIDVEYLARFGIRIDEKYQQNIEGMSMTETAVYFKEHFGIQDSIEKMKADWNEMAWDKYCNEVFLKDGVEDLLIYLKEKGIKTGIGTSNSIELTNAVLEHRGLADFFNAVHTANEVQSGKPSPDIYLLVAASLGVEPEKCLVFEDIHKGLCAAKSAGMKSCIVWDRYSEDDWNSNVAFADYSVRNFGQLL